jgi:Ca2+-binding RTX toxin-like protein
MAAVTTYSAYRDTPVGSSGSDLDQVLGWIARDPGLAGANEAASIQTGLAAANGLNQLLIQGLQDIGCFDKVVLTAADIVSLNAWFRDPTHPERLSQFIAFHGDDENGEETGFHTIQNDGGNRLFDGRTLIDTVLDGLYHIGFPLSADGTRLTNEDGADNASLTDVARWLTALKVDLATTGTGLDRLVETVVGDPGLLGGRPWADIRGGAEAANNLNGLILQGIDALKLAGAADSDSTRLSADEVRWINAWIRKDSKRLQAFIDWHGDDENGSETGYHLVQNDGATSKVFGLNAVNTVFDGIYHIGFAINGDGRFQNEDGDANARVSDVAAWITYYYGDASTTGSGLDRLVDWIKLDPGLPRWTSAQDINDGVAAANSLNQLLVEAISATDVDNDGWISRFDLREINSWVRANRYDAFLLLHGDDEGDGSETGFHKIQNDGASNQFFGQNLVNTVADGIYHFGFEIGGENFLNEDGDTNQSVSDVSGWLNYFLSDRRLTLGTWGSDTISGNEEADQVLARGGNDRVNGLGGDDLLDGDWGRDTLIGGDGADLLDGGFDDDWLDGGDDGDTYLVSGAGPDWLEGVPYSFQGFDTYADSGSSGTDVIRAEGFGAVDIGLRNFSAASGIEQILNASEGGAVRLLGNWQANLLDFSATELVGGPFHIDAWGGQDTVVGTALSDDIRGGLDDDRLDGGGAGDTYRVSGSNPEWIEGQPYSFEGFDTYVDSGASGDGSDQIIAEGDGPVDIGLLSFGPASGIERIVNATRIRDGLGGMRPAEVRLLGNWEANLLDFSATELVGGLLAGFVIEGGWGKDTLIGTVGADVIRGGGDDDLLQGGGGDDTYEISGRDPSNPDWKTYSFQGYDSYADTAGTDRILAVTANGSDGVDIGLRSFDPASGIELIDATGTSGPVRLLGDWQANSFNFSGTELRGGNLSIELGDGNDSCVGSSAADVISGGYGNDRLSGLAGDDSLSGGGGDDSLDGGEGNDTYVVRGLESGGWKTFGGYDSYADSGSGGNDRIVAIGNDDVDIGLAGGNFLASAGIEQIVNSTVKTVNGVSGPGRVRLLGNWENNTLNFSGVSILGGNIRIEAGDGNDTVSGSSANDTLLGGRGDDRLNGGAGSDTYEVAGTSASGFQGYDTWADSGSGNSELDRLAAAAGAAAVDIGMRAFSAAATGIEVIDATATSGVVRLLGDSNANTLNFSGVSLLGSNLRIDAGSGNDSVSGSAGADAILGGQGVDTLTGASGNDTLNGGGGLDVLSGGNGVDTFVYTTLTDAIIGGTAAAPSFERISGFTVGQDRFDLTTLPGAGGFKALGAVTALTTKAIGTLLNASDFVANGAATFTSGSGAGQRTFIAFNNDTAGFSASTDAVVEITGYGFAGGASTLAQISLV